MPEGLEAGAVITVEPLGRADPHESQRVFGKGVDQLVGKPLADVCVAEIELDLSLVTGGEPYRQQKREKQDEAF